MSEPIAPYTGNDPLLRWYADNGVGWSEARFAADSKLEFLRWYEVADGVSYEAIIDRVPEAPNLRLIVDVADLIGGVVDGGGVIRVRCPLTRRIAVGDTAPDHAVTAFTQGSAFFAASTCGHRRLGTGSAFFTDPRSSGAVARALARQVIDTAKRIAAGDRGKRVPADAAALGDTSAAPSVFRDCTRWPWRS